MTRSDYILTLLRSRGATAAVDLRAYLNRGGIPTDHAELYGDLVALEGAGLAKVALASNKFYGPRKWAVIPIKEAA